MGNEQKQENLNNQNIQEQEPKQMMPYVDNQDMKERATRFGTGGFAAIIYAVVTTICLYKNAYDGFICRSNDWLLILRLFARTAE